MSADTALILAGTFAVAIFIWLVGPGDDGSD